jgi:hypothetical protein
VHPEGGGHIEWKTGNMLWPMQLTAASSFKREDMLYRSTKLQNKIRPYKFPEFLQSCKRLGEDRGEKV